MSNKKKNILLISMPFAGTVIPAIQLPLLKVYLEDRGIKIATRHLYLKAAEIYGLKNYNYLIYGSNESYEAQIVFSKYLFSKHWKNSKEKIRKKFNQKKSTNKEIKQNFSFDNHIQQTDIFYNWIIENINWQQYDIIGFTLNYGQFLPSLAVSKKIKEMYPKKKIIFGGSRIIGNLGIKILEAFDYIDFIVSGEGEEALFLLASKYTNYKSIPHLIYRKGKEIIWNKSDKIVDLNSLPILDFDSFYDELGSISEEIKKFFILYGRLPIEISRGCWWNKCSFCSQNILHKKYREKKIDRIISEIQFLSDKYQILSFQMIGDTLPKKDYRILLEEIKKLNKDFSFFVEARAGQLKSKDYVLLKEAGFDEIQIGIETFSRNYIKKINKGVQVIDNIAALKYCKENGIKNNYNLIIRYPNEEPIDFEETKENIKLFKQYLNPPQISFLAVEFGSCILSNPEKFNIEKFEYTNIDKLMFPKDVLEKGISCTYNYKKKKEFCENNWEQMVKEWKNEYEEFEMEGIKKQTTIDKLVFYYKDGKNYLKIYDKRHAKNVKIYVLDKLEREIFLSCIDVITLKKICKKYPNVSETRLFNILKSFETSGIVFREGDRFLSLPLKHIIVK